MARSKYIGLFLFALVLLLKLPIIGTPHHWDTIRIEIKTAIWLLENNFNPFFGEIGFGHPPFLFELIALAFWIFGINLWAPHLLIILFSFLAAYFTFLVGSELYDKKTGIIASVLLIFSPLFFAQSGIAQIAVPFTALAVMTTYFMLRRSLLAYLVCGSALVMTKEPGVLMILLAVIYLVTVKKTSLRGVMPYALPLLVFFIWMAANRIILGWFLFRESVGYFGVERLLLHLAYNAYQIFIDDYRWVVAIPAVFYLHKGIGKGSIFPLSVIFSYLIFFSFMDIGMLPRYLLITHPFLFILGAVGIRELFDRRWIIVLPVIAAIFIFGWTGTRTDSCGCSLETNMEYLDLVKTHLAASRFIQENHPGSIVLTTWPQSDELTRVYEGYVERKIDVKLAYDNPDLSDVTLVYYSPQAHRPESLENIMKQMNLNLVWRSEKNGKYAEVYEVL